MDHTQRDRIGSRRFYAAKSMADTPVEPGQTEVRVTVQVVYSIE